MIRFTYNPIKAIQAMGYLVEKLGSVQKVALMKLMYLADREHFLKYELPITGDRLVAMPYGPLPSSALSMFDGDPTTETNVFDFLHLDDTRITLKKSPGINQLSTTEIQVLDEIAVKHGSKPAWNRGKQVGIVNLTHELPEYQKHYREGTSTVIPYESILALSGDPSRYRHGRAVITQKMANAMVPDFEVVPETEF